MKGCQILFKYFCIVSSIQHSFICVYNQNHSKIYKNIQTLKVSTHMPQQPQQQITVNHVIESYHMLSSEDPEQRYQANQFLCSLAHRDEAWQITQNMITNVQDPNFQFLGTQILYQKVSTQLQNLSLEAKNELKVFVFSKLEDSTIIYSATIDKLASIGALIASTLVMHEWPSFIPDLIGFMKKNKHNLRSGLFVVERIPEELRNTNRIPQGLKNNIIDEFLKRQYELSQVFISVLNMDDQQFVFKCLQAMQSWAKSRFNFLRYTEIMKKVLILSLESFNKFQSSIVMMLQIIKGAATNRLITSSLSQWEPIQQMQKYSHSQIQSIKLIISYILQNKENFLKNQVQYQYVYMYMDVIKQSLTSFGFLMVEKIGFVMLNVILSFTSSCDLRASQSTFEFWNDFTEKMLKCKITPQIKNEFAALIQKLFGIIGDKIRIQEYLLEDPDLKEDVTIDDINAMSFAQYRRETTSLYQGMYNFFLGYTGSSKYYFDKCFEYIGDEANHKLSRGTELALFCIKASIQSMITDQDAEYICKFVDFIIKKGTNIYPRIAVQTLLLIRDCTRQLKKDSTLCLNALNYSLFFLNDQKICFYAAQAFKNLIETLTSINDQTLIQNLINYYSIQVFSNQTIVDKIVQGIFIAITKISNHQAIQTYITRIVQIVINKFHNIHQNLDKAGDKPYLIPILEIKTILENFQNSGQDFLQKHFSLYKEILSNGLAMIVIVIPYCFKQKLNYVKFNELGLSCSIYRTAIKTCKNDISDEFLQILDQTLTILNKQSIINMCPVLELLCFTMTTFVPNVVEKLNNWIIKRLPYINQFFLTFMEPINLADADVLRTFYEIQQSLVLYNAEIFLTYGNPYHIFDLGLYVLRHLNEQKMQRKVVNFLYICVQMKEKFISRYPKVAEYIIGSIPIVSVVSQHNLSRMFLIVAPQVPNIRELLTSCLKQNPYERLSEQIINLAVNLIMITIDPNSNVPINIRERSFLMMIKDLNELAKTGEVSGKATQFEFRYDLWKKNKFALD